MPSKHLLCLCLLLPLWCQAAPVAIGLAAPNFELPTLPESGEYIQLADLRGKVVYVDFWASWCGPCRVSFPQLEKIHRELAARGFEVLAINVDEDSEDAMAFLAEVPVSYPVVYDGQAVTPQAYGILGMPTGFIVDREGVVRGVHQGFRKSDGEKLRLEILDILGD